ncbi:MAG: multiheme c-type cytochrome [Mariprofundaceae bacterium]
MTGLSFVVVAFSDSDRGGFPEGYWQQPVSATQGDAPKDWSEVESSLRPEACASCHATQFKAWRESLHAQAYSPGLIGQFPAMGHEEANGSCLSCHAPLQEQHYSNNKEMVASIHLAAGHHQGFEHDGDLKKAEAMNRPLTHAGVTCAACHVRDWQHFGPPRRNSHETGLVKATAHGGFVASTKFEKSEFCASCHQFPQSTAINGKPLENTLQEWKESSFARDGIQCQSCHMPDRKHLFKGIHDPETVRNGLDINVARKGKSAQLTLQSTGIGHAFPTYVTPLVIVEADAMNAKEEVMKRWQWEIIREVAYDQGWKEIRDTRLMPNETRLFSPPAEDLPKETQSILFRIRVIPDYFYKGVYQGLLSGKLQSTAETHIKRAVKLADQNDYTLFENKVEL